MEKWIEHTGESCPVDGNELVRVQTGGFTVSGPASSFSWDNHPRFRVSCYQILHQPQKLEQMTMGHGWVKNTGKCAIPDGAQFDVLIDDGRNPGGSKYCGMTRDWDWRSPQLLAWRLKDEYVASLRTVKLLVPAELLCTALELMRVRGIAVLSETATFSPGGYVQYEVAVEDLTPDARKG